ncbi:hypothetical protein ACH4VQ_36600 [Streptomyces anulatus]
MSARFRELPADDSADRARVGRSRVIHERGRLFGLPIEEAVLHYRIGSRGEHGDLCAQPGALIGSPPLERR